MKVVFLEEVEGSGHVGEVKNVANGFARNFLLPRGLAAAPTAHHLAIAHAKAEKDAKRQVRLDDGAREHLLPKLEGKSVTMAVRVGEQGKLFGSVTPRDIAEAVQADTGIELEHRQVAVGRPIRELGSYTVTLRLTRNIHVPLTVEVVGLGGETAEDVVGQPEEALGEVEIAVEEAITKSESADATEEELLFESEGAPAQEIEEAEKED